MKQSLTKLVDVILRRMEELPEAAPSEKGLRLWLSGQGYNKKDIDAAMKIVRPRFEQLPGVLNRNMTTVRLFSIDEEYKLSAEARKTLTRLELYGLLNPNDLEMVLEYLNRYEGEVGQAELDYVLSWLVCSNRDIEFQQTFFNVFEGKEDILH